MPEFIINMTGYQQMFFLFGVMAFGIAPLNYFLTKFFEENARL